MPRRPARSAKGSYARAGAVVGVGTAQSLCQGVQGCVGFGLIGDAAVHELLGQPYRFVVGHAVSSWWLSWLGV